MTNRLFLMFICLCLLAFETLADVQTITLQTADGLSIRADLSTPDGSSERYPAVILIHQGGSNRHEWDSFVPMLLEQGDIVLAYDVRGHGESDKVPSIWRLFNDPKQAPLDLRAAIDFLKQRKDVDPAQVAVVGASIGGNLAALSTAEMGVRTAVAISAKTSAVYNLAGTDSLDLRSVFYIASAGDQDGQRAIWARELYERTQEPRRLLIVPGSSAHGVHIFEDAPEIRMDIIQWLENTLQGS